MPRRNLSKSEADADVHFLMDMEVYPVIEMIEKLSKNSKELMRLSKLRDLIILNTDAKGEARTLNYGRTYNVETTLIQFTGLKIAKIACDDCKRDSGPFAECSVSGTAPAVPATTTWRASDALVAAMMMLSSRYLSKV